MSTLTFHLLQGNIGYNIVHSTCIYLNVLDSIRLVRIGQKCLTPVLEAWEIVCSYRLFRYLSGAPLLDYSEQSVRISSIGAIFFFSLWYQLI